MQNQLELNLLYENIAPMQHKKVAVFLGRLNPPTQGHYTVINAVKKFIRQHENLGLEATPVVIIIGGSKSDSDKLRNPLSISERKSFMKSSGKAHGVLFFDAPDAFSAFSLLREKGYEPIVIAAGSDRLKDYKLILDKYFLTPDNKKITHHTITLTRDEDATQGNVETALASIVKSGNIDMKHVSGSIARRAVELGYEPEFAKIVGLEDKPILAKLMFNKIKASIGEK